MFQRRRKKSINAEINIVPFLDVLLVLLLIFMVTAPIISQSVQVDLPESSQNNVVSNQDKKPIILEVSSTGIYTLIIEGTRYENISPDAVKGMSKTEFDKDQQLIFLVGGARDIPYEEVIIAINLLHDAGIKTVGLMTSPI